MDIIAQNKCSSLGMLFGAIALILGIFHFSFGPFSAPPFGLESVVAEKVSAVKKGILAGLKGEQPRDARLSCSTLWHCYYLRHHSAYADIFLSQRRFTNLNCRVDDHLRDAHPHAATII